MNQPDSATQAHASSLARGLAWGLSILAVPVLYLLSVPPLVIWVLDSTAPSDAVAPPRWLELYVAPAEWLVPDTLLGDPLRTNSRWCERVMRAP